MSKTFAVIGTFIVFMALAGIAGRWDMEDAKAAEKSYCESVRTHQTAFLGDYESAPHGRQGNRETFQTPKVSDPLGSNDV